MEHPRAAGLPHRSESPTTNVGESAATAQGGEAQPQRQTGVQESRVGIRIRAATSGSYRVVLVVDGKEFTQELRLITDPNLPALNDLLGAEEVYELWQGDDEPFDRDLKNAIKQSQAWARMFQDN